MVTYRDSNTDLDTADSIRYTDSNRDRDKNREKNRDRDRDRDKDSERYVTKIQDTDT